MDFGAAEIGSAGARSDFVDARIDVRAARIGFDAHGEVCAPLG
jgi:hypothetical protein